MGNRKFSWTQHQLDKAELVVAAIDELSAYLPVSLRQLFYRLFSAGHIDKTRSEYNMLSTLVTEMRHKEMIAWANITDNHRRVSEKRGWEDQQEYVSAWADQCMDNYERCLVQDQAVYLELWCEKDALSSVFERVAYPYCMRVVTDKGFSSTTFVRDFSERVKSAIEKQQQPVMLYFGDLDPSGWWMLEDIKKRTEDRFGLLDAVRYERIAINLDDIDRYSLPSGFEEINKKDTRYAAYSKLYGDTVVELDALHPAELERLAKNAIEHELDMDLFHQQQEIEQMEQVKVAAIRERVQAMLRQELRAV